MLQRMYYWKQKNRFQTFIDTLQQHIYVYFSFIRLYVIILASQNIIDVKLWKISLTWKFLQLDRMILSDNAFIRIGQRGIIKNH